MLEKVSYNYYKFATYLTKIVYINLLWLLFTIFGLVVFGITPASVAALTVIRKVFHQNEDIGIFSLFLKTYKSEFFRSNKFGLIFLVILYILVTQLLITSHKQDMGGQIAYYISIILLAVWSILVVNFLNMYVHFQQNNLAQYFKTTVSISICYLMYSITVLVVNIVMLAIAYFMPYLVNLLLVSLAMSVNFWVFSKILPSIMISYRSVS